MLRILAVRKQLILSFNPPLAVSHFVLRHPKASLRLVCDSFSDVANLCAVATSPACPALFFANTTPPFPRCLRQNSCRQACIHWKGDFPFVSALTYLFTCLDSLIFTPWLVRLRLCEALLPTCHQPQPKPNLMPEPDPELQATANLSPVSPSPVHSTVSQIVPALQDTVDTIDAMVAAAAAAAATNGTSESAPDLDHDADTGDIDDLVDDDSLNDPYGELETEETAPEPQPQPELADSNDDYAKMFDSPIDPEEGEGEDNQPEDVSSVLHESNTISTSSDNLINPSEASHAVPKSSSPSHTAQQSVPAATGPLAEANVTNTTNAPSQSVNTDRGSSQSAPSPSTAKADSVPAESPNPAADIQRLVADLTAPAAGTSPDPSASSAKAELPTASSSLPSALPSSASLPPRPPLPHSASQSYASQHHPTGSNSSVPASIVAPPTPGQPSTYVAAGAPGLPPDALGGLPAPPVTGLNAPVAITSMTAPPYPSHLPAYATDRAQDAEYERQWDQFVADERQYMSEAKWDRFPEGSRIFIGTRSASGASKIGAHIFSTGNLSSDKVSKRDVFDLFHRFGRLAQISLKSAYGFVQYHTVEEGRRAMENLQGIEIKGRRIRKLPPRRITTQELTCNRSRGFQSSGQGQKGASPESGQEPGTRWWSAKRSVR